MCNEPLTYICHYCNTSVSENCYIGQVCCVCGKPLILKINDLDTLAKRMRTTITVDKPSDALKAQLPILFIAVDSDDIETIRNACDSGEDSECARSLYKDLAIWCRIPHTPPTSALSITLRWATGALLGVACILLGFGLRIIPCIFIGLILFILSSILAVLEIRKSSTCAVNKSMYDVLKYALMHRIINLLEE